MWPERFEQERRRRLPKTAEGQQAVDEIQGARRVVLDALIRPRYTRMHLVKMVRNWLGVSVTEAGLIVDAWISRFMA